MNFRLKMFSMVIGISALYASQAFSCAPPPIVTVDTGDSTLKRIFGTDVELGIKSQLKRYTDAYKNKALIQKIGFVNGVVFTYSNGCVATYSFVSSPAPRDGMCSTSTLKGSLSCPAAIPTADVDSEQ